MAQGAIKKSSKPAPKKPTGPQRGSRVIKPKKAKLISQQKIKKKHASGLTAQTEKMLGEKAGHLELLRGGKKEKQAGKDKEKKTGK